jgi:quinol monooxygenase YgiN
MIVVIATVPVRPDKAGAYEALFRDLVAEVRAREPGNLLYQLSKSREEADLYKVVELYADQQALDAHIGSAHFQAVLPQIGGCLAGEPQIEFLDTVG